MNRVNLESNRESSRIAALKWSPSNYAVFDFCPSESVILYLPEQRILYKNKYNLRTRPYLFRQFSYSLQTIQSLHLIMCENEGEFFFFFFGSVIEYEYEVAGSYGRKARQIVHDV